jgi:glycerophosphoryl diester phosphodiesterase
MPLNHCLRIAHRDASALYPENTLLAFERALNAGVDLIELDVWLSRDNALVVIHDERLERTTNGCGAVRDQTLGAIRMLNAGCGQRVPVLAEVIELVRPTPVHLCIEIKGASVPEYQAIAAATAAQLEHAGFLDRAIIASFSPEALRLARALRPTLPALLDPTPQDGSLSPRQVCDQALAAGANCISHDIRTLTPALVSEAQLRGLAL